MSLRSLFALGMAAMLVGCSTPPRGRADLLNFLQVGNTRQADVQMQLGEPSALYERNHILAYRLSRDATGFVLVKGQGPVDWRVAKYNLMLSFDAQGVLRRYTLVAVNAP